MSSLSTNVWPQGLTRVPYWVFQRDDVYQLEQERLFRQFLEWNRKQSKQ